VRHAALWLQIVGKIRHAQSLTSLTAGTTRSNVSARGLTTSPIPYGSRVSSSLSISWSIASSSRCRRRDQSGRTATPIRGVVLRRPFWEELRKNSLWTSESPRPERIAGIPFLSPRPKARRLRRGLRESVLAGPRPSDRVFKKQFRARFIGNCNPLWSAVGSLDDEAMLHEIETEHRKTRLPYGRRSSEPKRRRACRSSSERREALRVTDRPDDLEPTGAAWRPLVHSPSGRLGRSRSHRRG